MENKLRMTRELDTLVNCAANAVNSERNPVNPSEFIRRTMRGYVNQRPVAPFDIHESCYKSGEVVRTIKGLPFQVTGDDTFRIYLARRCKQEIRDVRNLVNRSFAAEIPARPPATLEEAIQMECYVEAE